MKKLLSVLLCAVMVLSLAACGKKENAPTPGPDPNGETEGLTVALVVAGKLGDRSFYDSSKAVSYTHLDVYKRQRENPRSATPSPAIRSTP